MLPVVWITLILNSVPISKQVSNNNLKGNPYPFTLKGSHTPFSLKLRNIRKSLRKERINIPKLGTDNLDYEDLSEPLQYNYKEIWWTNYYPDPTNKPKNTTRNVTKKPNAVTKSENVTKISTKSINNHTTKISNLTTQVTNVTKKPFANETKKAFINVTKTTKANLRTGKRTQIETPSTQFVDENKGHYFPVFNREDNGQFSLIANQTNLFVKRNENDSDIRGSIKNEIFISNDFDLDEFDFIEVDVNVKDPNNPLRQNDKKERVVIDIVRTDNIAEDIKTLPPDEHIIIAPNQSAVLANIVKDGIYRIEIPEPVTKKVYLDMETNNNPAQQIFRPSRPMPNGVPAYHNVNSGYNRQQYSVVTRPVHPGSFYSTGLHGPFTQNPNYHRQGPFGGPNNFAQNIRDPIYNNQNPELYPQSPFYNPQNQGSYKQRPFYGPNNPGQDRLRPFYNPQYPGYNRQRPFYGINKPQQNRQRPFYNPQNPGYDRQRPFYGTTNQQSSFYNTKPPGYDRQGPSPNTSSPTLPEQSPNAEISSQSIQGPSYSTDDLKQDTQSPLDSTKGLELTSPSHESPEEKEEEIAKIALQDSPEEKPAPGYENVVFGVDAPTNPYRLIGVTRSTSTFEPGKGPIKDNYPVIFTGPTIGPITAFVEGMIADMEDLKMGFFSTFLVKLFQIVAKKNPKPLRKLLDQAQFEAVTLFDREHLLVHFGEPFGDSLKVFATHLSATPTDLVQSAASMLHHAMVNRREGLTKDINSVIDYIDSLYEDFEGVQLFRVTEDIDVYPDGDLDYIMIHRKLSEALYAPVKRLTGTAKRQILIDSINKVLENHSSRPRDTIARRQRNKISNTFDYTKYTNNKIHVTKERKINNQVTSMIKKDINVNKTTERIQNRRPSLRSTATINRTTQTSLVTDNTDIKSTYHAKPTRYNIIRSKEPEQRKIYKEIASFLKRMLKNKTEKYNPRRTTKSEVSSTDIIKPLSVKQFRPTNTALNNKNIFIKVTTKSDKFIEIKQMNADLMLRSKPVNPTSITVPTNILITTANDMSVEKAEETTTPLDISETDATTMGLSMVNSISIKEHKNNNKKKHKSKKRPHLHKKEIKHLRQKHPKMYKKYLKKIKKSKHDVSHKKSHKQHKKKSHHFNRKKKKQIYKKIKDISHLYKNLLKHHKLRKTNHKVKNDKSEKMVFKQFKGALDFENDTNEYYNNLYNSFDDNENEKFKDIKLNVMTTPKFAFITPFNKARYPEIDRTTKKWFHYPIKNTQLSFKKNFQMPNKRSENKFTNHNVPKKSIEFLSLENYMNSLKKINNIKKSSSYSDEENSLKFNLYDAMRHDKLYFKPQRRSFQEKENKNIIRSFSSYSSEEVVLKSNIYKAVEFNKYHSRANFSDIVRKDSDENSNKIVLRSRFKPVNEMTSYSDDEEILKQRLKQ